MIGQLAERYPDSDWAKVAKGSFLFGSGGIGGTGAQCGNYLGAGAVLAQIKTGTNASTGAAVTLGGRTTDFLRWFENTAIPTNASYIDYRGGTWTPTATAAGKTATWGGTGMPIPLNNAPKVKPQTTTCHGAHTKWKVAAASWLAAKGAGANQDRCGKTTYDSVFRLATMINAAMSGGTYSTPSDTVVAGCKTPACHGSTTTTAGYPPTGVSGVITCEPCHSSLAAVVPGHGM